MAVLEYADNSAFSKNLNGLGRKPNANIMHYIQYSNKNEITKMNGQCWIECMNKEITKLGLNKHQTSIGREK